MKRTLLQDNAGFRPEFSSALRACSTASTHASDESHASDRFVCNCRSSRHGEEWFSTSSQIGNARHSEFILAAIDPTHASYPEHAYSQFALPFFIEEQRLKTIRWGIIGCGAVTEVKSGPALQNAKHSALVAVMRRNGDLAKDYAARHGVPRWYDDAEALVNDREVDAVYVATPPSSHLDYTLLAARAGKPVYVEKPMARSYNECTLMIDACRDAGVPLFVAYYRRALTRFLEIKRLIEAGTIGDVRFVSITMYKPLSPAEDAGTNLPWRVMPEIAGGGHFVDLGSHMLDFLDFALGPIAKASGTAANQAGKYPAEDIVTGTFEFESGVLGAGTWCFSAFERCDFTEIVGTDGKISYATFGDAPISITTRSGTKEIAIEVPRHIQQELIQTIVNELNGEGKCPSTGESAARTSRVMDRMLGKSE